MELAHNGQKFIWNDKREGQRVYSKIDWMFINNEWLHSMPTFKVVYLAEGISDHCPIKITMEDNNIKQRRTFKYCNVEGYKMFQVVRKMKLLKRELRKLNTQYCKNVVSEAQEDRATLKVIQEQLNKDPGNMILQQIEREKHQKLRKLKQAIVHLKDNQGNWQTEQADIARLFVHYYTDLLGKQHEERIRAFRGFLRNGPILTEEHQLNILKPFTEEDAKKVVFSIDINKGPRPDGYGSDFFRAA
ncbi:uncharacterized protein [Nicotiana sylvestris]|uniref:uncharacterized protein n=1 Tax=Nicotiana sylvestris TaxID=4096 RepID=UPI00388CAC8B